MVRIEGKGSQVDDRSDPDVIRVDGTLYPVPAVLRACYSLADIGTFEVQSDSQAILIQIAPALGYTLEAVVERLRTSLIDFALREDIEVRTRDMRELIWKTAFGEAIGPDGP
ncbi:MULTISPECIES: His-Xaa-Ser system protein HxsD [unclassified Bradyrhizobium]|uniref:His-Xaa-Ser system protein HxsD n=1 Tax=unclassified Bradyrhizobium TaxID=2631580 RepID=UPI0028F0BA6D|nr:MULTISPECIES: His-Xaa-Ser system protein HxsD [unclassified Bradyrhizobium]